MKRFLCLSLILVALLGCFTACDLEGLVSNMASNLENQSESAQMVKDMMTALCEGRAEDAKALMHPTVAERADDGISQMIAFLDGREVGTMNLQNINLSTSGGEKEESLVYAVELSDGKMVFVQAVYLSDDDGAGFSEFQFVMGVF